MSFRIARDFFGGGAFTRLVIPIIIAAAIIAIVLHVLG